MTAQFAGSRSLDDRRRRRLAQESGREAAPGAPQRQLVAREGEQSAEAGDVQRVQSDVVSAESLVPEALWKVSVYAVLGLLAWGGLVWLNWREGQSAELLNLVSPEHSSAFQFFSVLCLILSSQLAFMIWWYRSRSRKDFGGRYRIWGWAGCFWGMTCVSVGMGLHRSVAALAYARWPVHSWRPELLYWFVPFAIGVLALHQLISQEMRHSRISRLLWNTTLVWGVFAASLQFGLTYLFRENLRALISVGVASLWHFLISYTFLYHARFVVHVTNEAAPRGVSWFVRLKVRSLAMSQTLKSRFDLATAEGRDKRAVKRELRRSARAHRQAELEIQRADRRKKRDLETAQKKAHKAGVKAERDAARESRQADQKIADQVSKSDKRAQVKSGDEERGQVQIEIVEPRTPSGKKRKRVLGHHVRVDQASSVQSPHAGFQDFAVLTESSVSGSEDVEVTEWDESESEFGNREMNQREKRKTRKNRR